VCFSLLAGRQVCGFYPEYCHPELVEGLSKDSFAQAKESIYKKFI